MLLADRIKSEFSVGDRDRGDFYFRRDRARIIDQSPDYTAALVDNSEGDSYFVQVNVARASHGIVGATCECPRFANGFPCKHIWATIRCIDEIAPPPGEERLRIQEEDAETMSAEFGGIPGNDVVLSAESNHERTSPSRGDWKKTLRSLLASRSEEAVDFGTRERREPEQQCWYVVSLSEQSPAAPLKIDTYLSARKRDGGFGKPVRRLFNRHDIINLSNSADRRILSLISNSGDTSRYRYYASPSEFLITADLGAIVAPLLCKTSRFVWTLSAGRALEDGQPLEWDEGPAWKLELTLRLLKTDDDETAEGGGLLQLDAALRRGEKTMALSDIVHCAAGLILTQSRLHLLDNSHSVIVSSFAKSGQVTIPEEDFDQFMMQLGQIPNCPPIHFDSSLVASSEKGSVRGLLEISADEQQRSRRFQADIRWVYGEQVIAPTAAQQFFWDASSRHMTWRDTEREAALTRELLTLPLKFSDAYYHDTSQLTLAAADLDAVVLGLAKLGWEIRAFGKKLRRPGIFDIRVTSNSDWFDLDAKIDFDGQSVSLPRLLRAVRQKKSHVLLDDGTHGLLPTEWLERYGHFAELATGHADTMRFSRSQALLLDTLLAEQEHVTVDRNFTDLLQKLASFQGVEPAHEPPSFRGELRDYQRDGLGWMKFLNEFGFGGCLADDMGLGKTVQVLAMLEERRLRHQDLSASQRPTLVVVPKSLVFNWIEEAARFTPQLRLLNYTGIDRVDRRDEVKSHDVIVTTYGTVRRDVEFLTSLEFDYVILDESQAIKNAKAQASKACRLLKSRHRLAMTGTPIENHLGELWTLLEFLNPGMLGSEAAFRKLTQANETESLDWLARALRPYLMRRTKDQVLRELPEKTEQTLYCDMEPKQKKLYSELRDYYRSHIGDKVRELGVKKSKIHVLEALLRLRQAACDPRLLDKNHEKPGAKIELLIDQLAEVIDEGHKALVFSQFTSLLALVRQSVESQGWDYEYLDGKTRKRADRVKRFQSDDDCKLFLISLKAGGQGLNLTAADYVFILDPWWNPAVEAQAIDRAHRMGQTRSVNAYRLICRDTVEEKIVALQQSKKELADAIVTANKSLLSELSLDELKLLFG